MLAAFVEERHDDIDPAGLSADCGNDSLQILKMIVRGHVILVSEQGIGQAVVADVNQNVDVVSADGFVDHTFALAGTETGSLGFEDITAAFISFILGNILFVFCISAPGSPLYQVVVHLLPEGDAACKRNDAKPSDRQGVKISFVFLTHGFFPPKSFFWIRISLPNSLIIV